MEHGKLLCEKPFWEDPIGIFTKFSLNYCTKCQNQIYNFIVRLFIIATVLSLLFIGTGYGTVVVPVVFAIVILLGSMILLSKMYGNQNNDNYWHNKSRGCDISSNDPNADFKELPMTTVTVPSSLLSTDASGNSGSFGPTSADMQALAQQTQMYLKNQQTIRGSNMMNTPSTMGGQPVNEGFSDYSGKELGLSGIGAAPYKADSPLPDYTLPAARNPFMNILLDEYKYNPTRPTAAPVSDPLVKTTMDDFFRVQWFSDPTDVFGKNQDQRQFISQAVTSVPNDQKSFQEWLYLIPGKTCKEGNPAACLPGTDGSPITWLNQEY